MARMTYEQALYDSSSLFAGAQAEQQYGTWGLVLEVGDKPLEAFRVFKTKEAAETIVAGDEGFYDIYPGAVVSVVKDGSTENNGLYHVELADRSQPSSGLKLVKMLSEEDASVSGQITVLLKNETGVAGRNGEPSSGWSTPGGEDPNNSGGKTTPYIYFVGVDSSTREQHPDTLYFNDGIVYDASGSNLFQNSDERLKNVVANIEPNLDELRTIDKVVFNWKQDKSHKNNIGVIAQTVEKLYPELVINNPDSGYKMVNYAGLSVIALAAVDKLYERVQDLEAEVDRLKNMK